MGLQGRGGDLCPGGGEEEGILRQVLQVPLYDLQDDRVRLEGVHGPQVVGGGPGEHRVAEALRQQAVEGVAEGVAEHEEVPVCPGAGGLNAQVVHVPDGGGVLKGQVLGEVPLVLQLVGGGIEHDVQVPLVVFLVIPLPLEHVPGPSQVGEEGVVGQGGALVGPVGVPLVVQVLLLLGEGSN